MLDELNIKKRGLTGRVNWITGSIWSGLYREVMSHVTQAELVEIVPDLRAMACVETSAEVCAALIRLADRYAAMATEDQDDSLPAI
jgi:hypothetical protein